jgi:imidazolonepropionase-like amidohydrolase
LLVSGAIASMAPEAQAPAPAAGAVLYEGARLIIGPAAVAPIEDGAFVVQNGRITAIGRRGQIQIPVGAARVNLTRKTVMPAMVNVHAHFGYEKFTRAAGDSRPEHYTPENLLDHFQREAYYGVGTVHDGGTASVPISLQFQADQRAGKYSLAAEYSGFNVGIVPPAGGPDQVLIKGSRPLKANYEVTTARDARAAVQEIAARNVRHIKIWLGDRNEEYPAMPYHVYEPIIEAAHKRNMKVHGHALELRDQKDVVGAGADLLVHTVSNEPLDDELLGHLKAHRPYWVPSIGTGIGNGFRREVCENDPFTSDLLPPAILAELLANECRRNPNAAQREAALRRNFQAMLQAGARLVLGTDAGIRPSKTFGSSEHHELTIFVRLGRPIPEAIEAATVRAAEVLGRDDVGTLAAGKQADFIVLDANPLADILNTRRISDVYLDGIRLDRAALLAKWKKPQSSTSH